jgi:hypothetical protein
MSKTTLSILGSILMSSALAHAAPDTIPRQHHLPHLPGIFGSRLMSRFAEPRPVQPARTSGKTTGQKPVRLDSGNYTIFDHPSTDPSWGTRAVGINENSVLSGYYLNKDDGAFHAYLLPTKGGDPIDIQIGYNDTFGTLLNDKNEAFGTYIDADTGVENAWVRTKNGAVIPFQTPHGTNGGNPQFINNKGVLTGVYFDDSDVLHCFTRTRKGVLIELPDAPNAGSGDQQGSQCIGINNKGDIGGSVIDNNNHFIGFIRHAGDGSYEEFEAPDAGAGEFQGTIAAEVDEHGRTNGQVVDANDVMHGFIRSPQGKFTIVDAPDAGTGPGQGTVAVEHCDGGWCVGEYIDANDVNHGYYCTDYCKKRGEIVEFDPPGAGDIGTYVVISSNKAHQIAGTFKDDNAVRHGFIRNPE